MGDWISIDERLPKIPDGKHGVTVIGATYDHYYAESLPDGKKHLAWDVNEIRFTRKYGWTMILLQADGKGWSDDHDVMPPSFWQYMPEAPK